MLMSPVQRKYVIEILSENDFANIFSRFACERFGEIYSSDGTCKLCQHAPSLYSQYRLQKSKPCLNRVKSRFCNF